MESVDVLLEPARAVLIQIGGFLPRLALAIVVLVLGLLVAKAVRFAIEKALRAINFHIVTQRSGLDGFLQQGGLTHDTTALCGLLAYWLVILAALMIASNGLDLTYVTDLLSRVMLFVPRIIVAVVILTLGAYFARFAGNAVQNFCRSAGIGDADALGKLAQYIVAFFVLMMALDQVHISGDILRQTFLIVLAGVMLALALAFGLGGRAWAAARLERWWPTLGGDDEAELHKAIDEATRQAWKNDAAKRKG
jgi:hypothetical protein